MDLDADLSFPQDPPKSPDPLASYGSAAITTIQYAASCGAASALVSRRSYSPAMEPFAGDCQPSLAVVGVEGLDHICHQSCSNVFPALVIPRRSQSSVGVPPPQSAAAAGESGTALQYATYHALERVSVSCKHHFNQCVLVVCHDDKFFYSLFLYFKQEFPAIGHGAFHRSSTSLGLVSECSSTSYQREVKRSSGQSSPKPQGSTMSLLVLPALSPSRQEPHPSSSHRLSSRPMPLSASVTDLMAMANGTDSDNVLAGGRTAGGSKRRNSDSRYSLNAAASKPSWPSSSPRPGVGRSSVASIKEDACTGSGHSCGGQAGSSPSTGEVPSDRLYTFDALAMAAAEGRAIPGTRDNRRTVGAAASPTPTARGSGGQPSYIRAFVPLKLLPKSELS